MEILDEIEPGKPIDAVSNMKYWVTLIRKMSDTERLRR